MTDTLDAIAREMIAETETNKSGFGIYPKIRDWADRLRNLLVSHAVESTNLASTEQAEEEKQGAALSNQGEGEPIGYLSQASINSLAACKAGECNGFVEVWMRPDEVRSAPLYLHPAEADRRDAERYRAIRNGEWCDLYYLHEGENHKHDPLSRSANERLDAACDAATQEQT